MQRKEIDRQEYDAIRDGLADRVETPGIAPITDGVHADYGRTILIAFEGRFWCDADNVSLIRGSSEITRPRHAYG